VSLAQSGAECELCAAPGLAPLQGTPVWPVLPLLQLPALTVVRVLDSPAFPAFYRVIWRAHVAEWSDLTPAERAVCMEAVAAVEQVLRAELKPSKINLASLGNLVPHLHWHVIARFDWDSHFPQTVWGAAQRQMDDSMVAALRARMPAVDARIVRALGSTW
jgi:diadenosine tetraphosphate (Ap4A) HIT family hydrolase